MLANWVAARPADGNVGKERVLGARVIISKSKRGEIMKKRRFEAHLKRMFLLRTQIWVAVLAKCGSLLAKETHHANCFLISERWRIASGYTIVAKQTQRGNHSVFHP